jgi:hypothetical protein
MNRWFVLLVLAGLFPGTTALHGADASGVNLRRQQFKQLLADEWEYELRESPERATSIGDYRYNDRFSDISLAHVQQQKRTNRIGWPDSRPLILPASPSRKS